MDSHCILVIDTEIDTTYGINYGERSGDEYKWSGITTVGKKMFCSPYCSSSILIIDGDSESIRKISCNDSSEWKWWGITALGTIAYCAPYNSKSMLIIDTENETIQTIDVKTSGNEQWQGLTAVTNNKVVCAPFKAEELLMIEDGKASLSMWGLV